MQISRAVNANVEFRQSAGQQHSRHASGQAVQTLDNVLRVGMSSHDRTLKMEFFGPHESYRCWLDTVAQSGEELQVQAG
jgi:hypothetical protein